MMKTSTRQAIALKLALEARGLHVLSELYDGHKHIDLAIPAARINIEVDGPKHYENAHQILADLERSHHSELHGYYTMHICNEHIENDLEKIAKALTEAAHIRIEKLKTLNPPRG